jgi:drug/metabolite transporter (DMT)-like permease
MPIGPFSAILLAVAFLGERPSGSLLIGAAFILGGTILFRSRRVAKAGGGAAT